MDQWIKNEYRKFDRVKLAGNALQDALTSKRKLARARDYGYDWKTREGTVIAAKHYVNVVWDGNKHADQYDPRSLEKV
jgi:hypothetical protein